MNENRIIPDMSNADYHDHSAFSRSDILRFMQSPFKYHWYDRDVKKQTPEMIFGSAFHTLVLEPELFDKQYAVEPIKVKLKDVGREIYDRYKKECAEIAKLNKTVLSMEDYNELHMMAFALLNDSAYSLIAGGKNEQSYFWTDPHTGLQLKARPDVVHDDYIVDLKTIKSGDTRSFQSAMIEGGYHIQAAMIRDAIYHNKGKRINKFFNVCVEKTHPYEIAVKIISERAIDHGEEQYKNALLRLAECIRESHWPSYSPEIVDLPEWYYMSK